VTALLSVTALLPIVQTVFGRRRRGLREVQAEIVTDYAVDGDEFAERAAEDEAEIATDSRTDVNELPQPGIEDEAEAEVATDSGTDVNELPQPATEDEAEAEIATDSGTDVNEFPQPAAEDEATMHVGEPEPDVPRSVIPIPEVPSVSLKEWTCEIAFWRGHEKATFYARTFRAGEELAIAESEPFEVDGDGSPGETDAARKAHDALCDQLVQSGWERFEREGEWYSDGFRRDFTATALVTSLTTRISFARRPSLSG